MVRFRPEAKLLPAPPPVSSLSDMVLIGDRGMFTSARIREDLPASQGIQCAHGRPFRGFDIFYWFAV